MACEIMTEGVLKAALRHQLPADQRAALLRHLREPCEACLDLLEGWTAEEMMTSLCAPDDLLSLQEQERVFAAAAPAGQPSGRPALRIAHLESRRLPWLAWGGAAAALALVVLVTVVRPGSRDEHDGLKGAPTPTVTLIPLVGARAPTPHVVRALAAGGRFAPGEVLLLRIRLKAPAWVYLLSQKQGEAAELIWPSRATARHEPGEFELAESGSALAVDPSALGNGGRVLLIASLDPIEPKRLQVKEALRTRADVEKTFPGCGVDLLDILTEAR
jgi:hypothetical protein